MLSGPLTRVYNHRAACALRVAPGAAAVHTDTGHAVCCDGVSISIGFLSRKCSFPFLFLCLLPTLFFPIPSAFSCSSIQGMLGENNIPMDVEFFPQTPPLNNPLFGAPGPAVCLPGLYRPLLLPLLTRQTLTQYATRLQ